MYNPLNWSLPVLFECAAQACPQTTASNLPYVNKHVNNVNAEKNAKMEPIHLIY